MDMTATVLGLCLVVVATADMVNAVVATTTSQARFWPSRLIYRTQWRMVRAVALRIRDDEWRERLLATYAPVSVLGLLAVWVALQVVGWSLVWWASGDVTGVDGVGDAFYFSGVVYFTVGFGEIVPTGGLARAAALVEAFGGVLTTALVIGYLPALYGAYSERERKLMTLDDGTEDRITPTSLVLSRIEDGDASQMYEFCREWEAWIAGVLETHTTFPMLRLFRSKDPGQHWVTALGLVTDAALHLTMVRGAERDAPYWLIRRSIRLFQVVTDGADLEPYLADPPDPEQAEALFAGLYATMVDAGFDLLPMEEAKARARELRRHYAPRLEFMIDAFLAPRGFWGHAIGQPLGGAPSGQSIAADE